MASPDQGRLTAFRHRQFNRKNPAPSAAMHPSDGGRYQCAWLTDTITIHSDGNVSCGLDDPNSQRTFGNIKLQPIAEIFRNSEYVKLQNKLWAGYRCDECKLYQPVYDPNTERNALRPSLPSTLIIEPTVRCNIRCLNEACYANNDSAIHTRDADIFPLSAFCNVIDQLRETLRYVYFFNYGDPFVNAQAEDMLLYLREACPEVKIVTSTNGIPISKPSRATKIVQSQLDFMTFTIGGVTQESYSRYHVNGKVELALQGLNNVLTARRELQLSRPWVVWRYLLFRWNDSDEEIARAFEISKDLGVDQFILYLTHMPIEGTSYRFAPGTPNFVRYRAYIDSALDYAKVCGIPQPDENGFFPFETIEGLGSVRWTSWKARMAMDGRSGWISIGVTTNRPGARSQNDYVLIKTPWITYKVPLCYMAWTAVTLRVPRAFRKLPVVQVSLLACNHWFPASEIASPDLRCLGVLVDFNNRKPSAIDTVRRWWKSKKFMADATKSDVARIDEVTNLQSPDLVEGNAGQFVFGTS